MTRLIACNHNQGVIGGCITINRDSIERALSDIERQLMHQLLANARIGSNKTEHGGHIGPYHPRALADTCDIDVPAIYFNMSAGRLGYRIGGHDALCCTHPVIRLRVGECRGQTLYQAINR